jgi:hypothetical protein
LAIVISRRIIGRQVITAEPFFAVVGAGNSIACVLNKAQANIWVNEIDVVCKKDGSSAPTVRVSAYIVDDSLVPQYRLGYAISGAATGTMTNLAFQVIQADNAPTNNAFMVFYGDNVAVDVETIGHDLDISEQSVGNLSGTTPQDSYYFYRRTSPGDPPPYNFGSYTPQYEGGLTVNLYGYLNEGPETPSSGRYPISSISETVPVFTADFKDKCGAYGASSGLGLDLGDVMSQYRIQVRRVSDQVMFWNNLFNANVDEENANAVQRTYLGTTLVRGTAYEWRIQQADAFGFMSAWSSWLQFTPANLGFITLDNTPNGKQTTVQPDFHGRWNHQSATSMKTVETNLYNAAGTTVLQTGANYDIADVASAALPGTLFTVTWANTGFSTLNWGTNYSYRMRGWDGTQWSDWSALRTFNTDAAPTTPGSLAPNDSSTPITGYPLLAAKFSDPDDTYTGSLTGVFRITRPDTTTVDVTPTYNATTGNWEFQTTITQINQFGVYSWKATGYDGTLYSGQAVTLGAATWSNSATFDYETGPVVAISSPSSHATIATSALPVSWSLSSGGPQAQYRIKLFVAGNSTAVYDSGYVVSTAQNATIPSGYYLNGNTYQLTVTVKDGSGLAGSVSAYSLLISYTPATAVNNVAAVAIPLGADPIPTAIQVTWDQTSYSAFDFTEYTIRMQADGGPDANPVIIARLSAPSNTSFIYEIPASGYNYTFGVSVVILVGADELESDPTEDTASISLKADPVAGTAWGTVLSILGDGQNYRSFLDTVTTREPDRQIIESVYTPLSGANPSSVRQKTRYFNTNLSALVFDSIDGTRTGAQKIAELDALDARAISVGAVLCYRNGDGAKEFVDLVSYKPTKQLPDYWAVSLTIRGAYATEGTI